MRTFRTLEVVQNRSMIIYFLRHASAGQYQPNSQKDEKRPIDEKGKQQCRDVGRALAAMKVDVDVVISSPLTRAMQTAELVTKEFGHKGKVVVDDAMRPEATYDQFHELVTKYKDKDAILVVGHDPSITEFLVQLLAGTDAPEFVDFKKGAVAKVGSDGQAKLNWVLTPKLTRALQSNSAKSSRPKTSRK